MTVPATATCRDAICPVMKLVTSPVTHLADGTATNDKSKHVWVNQGNQGYQCFSFAATIFRLAVLEPTMSHLKVVFVLSGVLPASK